MKERLKLIYPLIITILMILTLGLVFLWKSHFDKEYFEGVEEEEFLGL